MQWRAPSASFIEAVYPLSTDAALRTSVSDHAGQAWSTFRLGKFLEAVDALTADVAYRHTDGERRGLALVTAGHYHSRKLAATDPRQDVVLRCYLTACGGASLEVRTDAVQVDEVSGEETLVNVCHTTMVALCKDTMRPARRMVPPLALEVVPPAYTAPLAEAVASGEVAAANAAAAASVGSSRVFERERAKQGERAALSAWHGSIRKQRRASTMQLRLSQSLPPTPEEMQSLHAAHIRLVDEQTKPAGERPKPPRTVRQSTYRSSFVLFPEQRNVHGKLFGGFVAASAFDLAYYGATFFAQVHL